MKAFFQILFLLISIQSFAQSFAEEHYSYDTHYKMMAGYYHRGLYLESIQYIDSLEGNKYINRFDYFFFARLYSLNNQFDKALFYVEKAVKNGITKEQIETMYDLDKFRESHLNMVFELNYEKWNQEYQSSLSKMTCDSIYYHEIKELYADSKKNSRYKVTNINGDEVHELKDSLELYQSEQKNDSMVFEKLTDLIIEKGFPTYKKVGSSFFSATHLLQFDYNSVQNSNHLANKWSKIESLIKKEMELGNLKPFYSAYFEDLHQMQKNEPQVYLTTKLYFSNPDLDDTKVVEPQELNIRRKSIGLCSIQLEYWAQAKELPLSLRQVNFK